MTHLGYEIPHDIHSCTSMYDYTDPNEVFIRQSQISIYSEDILVSMTLFSPSGSAAFAPSD